MNSGHKHQNEIKEDMRRTTKYPHHNKKNLNTKKKKIQDEKEELFKDMKSQTKTKPRNPGNVP
jgi:NTP pyrophosphatase (non-canonical NTP hydrolase)